jgi:hypothetical protein
MNVFTVETKNGFTKWNLDSKCKREVQPIADEFGMGIEKFLFLYTLRRLPGQLVRHNDVDEENTPRGFAVTACEDPATWDRVKRAAKCDGLSIEEFVWQAVAGSVNCTEADVLLSPSTGDAITTNCRLEEFIVGIERHEI